MRSLASVCESEIQYISTGGNESGVLILGISYICLGILRILALWFGVRQLATLKGPDCSVHIAPARITT